MRIHNWKRAEKGSFHHLHNGWIARLADALNAGLLPEPYYAGAEQVAAGREPDVLVMHREPLADVEEFDLGPVPSRGGGVLAEEAPPAVEVVQQADPAMTYPRRKNRIVIRHANKDQVVALVEIVSPGNKSSRAACGNLVTKLAQAMQHGVHVLLIDLLPPGPGDPDGLHARLWSEYAGEDFEPPAGKPLTLAAYRCADVVTAYVQPTATGEELIDMPLFFEPDRYVNAPLAATYAGAVAAMPKPWRRSLEATLQPR